MLPRARLCHYGRRFSTFFPNIADRINPLQKSWLPKLLSDLADYVATLDPSSFQRLDVPLPRMSKKQKKMNATRAFLQTWEWRELRYQILKERGARCELCGATSKDQRIEVDHIKPISKFWHLRLDRSNLQVLCRDCNKGKGNRHFDDFRKMSASAVQNIP